MRTRSAVGSSESVTLDAVPSLRDRPRLSFGLWLGTFCLLALLLTALAADRSGHPGFSAARVAFWWAASIALLLSLVAWADARSAERKRAIAWPRASTITMWLGMTVLAAAPRLVVLDRFPTVLDGDEAGFMLQALEFRNGEMPNPFGTGYFSSPLGFIALQGMAAGIFGDDVWAYRIPAALLGVVGVLVTWRLGARLFGEVAGAIAGALLAIMPFHIHFSRLALNNVTDATFFAMALLFGLRALDHRRALDALVAGSALGFALYGYYGGRALWAVVLIVVIALAITGRTPWRTLISTVVWIAAGAVTVALPLIVTFWNNPAEFSGHLSQVSEISVETFRHDPVHTSRLYLGNLFDALAFPFWADASGFYRHERPLIGWTLAILVLAGLGVILMRAVRRKSVRSVLVVLLPYLLVSAGIAVTIPIASQRYLAVTPLLAIVAGSGLATLTRSAARLVSGPGTAVRAALAVAVVIAIGVPGVRWVASEDRQLETYGDLRTTMMWDIGWRLREGNGDVSRLLIVGPPWVYANGFPNLTFLAPDVVQEDIPGQFLAGVGAPDVPADAILILVPERMGERCAIEAAYPDATVMEASTRDGTLLYVAFTRGEDGAFRGGETPAETTLVRMHSSPCDSAG